MASSERTKGTAAATAAVEGTRPHAAAGQSSTTGETGHAISHAAPGNQRKHSSGDSSRPEAPAAPTLDGLRISCLMNSRYHASREAFLDTVHRWFMFAVIALGTAAVINVLPSEVLGIPISAIATKVFAASAGIIAALDLTFDLSNRARTHAMMKRRYFELIADVIEKRRSLIEASACLNRYSADEEPAYHTLLIASWNDAQKMVYGDEADYYEIPPRHLRFKNLWRYIGENYQFKHGLRALSAAQQ